MVAVIAAVGGEIEGHRKPLLPGLQIAAVEGVALLSGGETGVLANGPWPAGVHRGIGPAGVGRQSGEAAVDPGEIIGTVDVLEADMFGRIAAEVLPARL